MCLGGGSSSGSRGQGCASNVAPADEVAAVAIVGFGALEAFLRIAADIVRSVISPTWQDIGQLGAIAVIRTFLNFFLERISRNTRNPAPDPRKSKNRQPSRE